MILAVDEYLKIMFERDILMLNLPKEKINLKRPLEETEEKSPKWIREE